MKHSLFIFLFTFISITIIGQDRYLGISAGGALYTGDIDPISRLNFRKNVDLAFGLFYRQELSDRFSFRLNLSRLNISAADNINDDFSTGVIDLTISRLERNFNIKNKITEFSVLGEIKVFSIRGVDFHFTAGPAIYRHNPMGFDIEDMIYRPLQPLATEDQSFDERYSLFQFSIPFGGYFTFDINEKISLQFDLIGRYTFTDYLDDIHLATYVRAEDISEPIRRRLADPFESLSGMSREEAAPSYIDGSGIIRGNPDVRDYFGSSMLTVLFRMPNLNKQELGCPVAF